MEKLTMSALLARVAVASLCACAATFAYAGGNGNGGSGGGSAHGAATAGMTYHGEPVSSPWNRPPGNTMSNGSDMAHTEMSHMSHMAPDGNTMPANPVQ
jgi:hypothetical protein